MCFPRTTYEQNKIEIQTKLLQNNITKKKKNRPKKTEKQAKKNSLKFTPINLNHANVFFFFWLFYS